jgi:hypothetical protein
MRLRFTIRDLLWLTAVVALATGWWIDHTRIENERGLLRHNALPQNPMLMTPPDTIDQLLGIPR